MVVSIGKCARQPRFSIGKCARQPRFSIGKCVNTNLSCGGIVPKWADKLPKQELFHRNLEPRRHLKETSPHPLGTRARKLHMVGAVGRPRICCANTHRLRPPTGVLARGLKTLTRFLYARALHRVRFSAVRTRNKKTGRYEYLPVCCLWWRRGESNSGPRKPPDWHLQAQSLV